ncbi:MAG: pre-peptidase C-terminal domain-containing protein [Anaerolineales bacterium]|nr:pre-peptidase C-terminal domain-containing protein [Anaerolineales bacterium]
MINQTSKIRILIICAALLYSLFFTSQINASPLNTRWNEPGTPLTATLMIDQAPLPDTPATVTCLVSTSLDAPGTSIQLELPDNAQLVSGALSWQGDLYPDSPVALSATILFNSTGKSALFCRALKTVSEDEVWGDLGELYLEIGLQASRMGYSSPVREERLDYNATLKISGDAPPLPSSEISPTILQDRTELPPAHVPSSELKKTTPSAEPPPGALTVTGSWSYWDRDDNVVGALDMLIELVRGDNGDHLAYCFADFEGDYTCGPVTNPGAAGVKTVMISYANYSPYNDMLIVINPDWGTTADLNNAYGATQPSATVLADGTQNIGDWVYNNGAVNERAFWIERDLINTWRFIWFGSGSTQNPQESSGPGTVEWKSDSTDGTYYSHGGNIHLTGADPLSNSVVSHEYGHNIMYTIYGNWMPTTNCPDPHYVTGSSHVNCAWTEGWANFLPLAVNNDPIYRWANGASLNLETPTWGTSSWDNGADVEGRVAGALWDMYDSANDGFDLYSEGEIVDIWDTLYHQNNNNFTEYWTAWTLRGHNQNGVMGSIYQNTIDYLPVDDNYESNDTLGTAYDITTQERVWLTGIDGIGVQADNDWYKIEVTSGYQRVQVDARFIDSEGDIDIRLCNAAGTSLASSTSTSDNEFIDFTVPSGGAYYIQVYYDNLGNGYNLWWDDLESPPGAFSKTSPSNGAVNQPTNPTLSWGTSSLATRYFYCIDDSDDDACSTWITLSGETSVDLSGLEPNTTYYWHVRSLNASGDTYSNGSTTAYWSFTTSGPDGLKPPADFDGDGDTDISVYRPSNGYWYAYGQTAAWWGLSTDRPVPGDYDADGTTDKAFFRPSNGYWYVRDGASYTATWWGQPGDIPVPGDYDGDGDTDYAIMRPSNGYWYVREPAITQGGYYESEDIPVPCDYDGDGDDDIAIFRPSNGYWYVLGQSAVWWGTSLDIPMPGDYDGDGACDFAFWRPYNGYWYVRDGASYTATWWGQPGDIPVPGDYDGDGDTDLAIIRPSNGYWYVREPAITQGGWYAAGDFPLPARDTNGDGDPWQ